MLVCLPNSDLVEVNSPTFSSSLVSITKIQEKGLDLYIPMLVVFGCVPKMLRHKHFLFIFMYLTIGLLEALRHVHTFKIENTIF